LKTLFLHDNFSLEFWALINNAGICNFCGIEYGKGVDIFRNELNVNTLGVVRITKTFLPLLRKTQDSRIVIVGSMAGGN